MTLVQKTLKNQKGLTLIELLAVIVILGIIAAIAVPAIGSVISDSRDKATVSEAVNIIAAAKLAQASGLETSTDSWDLSDLNVTNVDANNALTGGISVSFNPDTGEFSIVNHAAIALAGGGAESDLTRFLTTGKKS